MGDLAKPKRVVEILSHYGIRPKKRLGQHFLVDGNVLRRQLEVASPTEEDTVLEIGPGLGALTEELLNRAGRVVAVEADEGLCRVLDDILGHHPRLQLVRGDALRTSLRELFSPEERVVMVSNLPYNAATPIIFKVLDEISHLRLAVVTVQKELADRYVAEPGNPAYGAVSAKLQHICEVEKLANVPPTVFLPPPKVESSLVRIKPRCSHFELKAVTIYFQFLEQAFSQRRKTLANNLSADNRSRDEVINALIRLGKDPKSRAEQLSPPELYRLYEELKKPSKKIKRTGF